MPIDPIAAVEDFCHLVEMRTIRIALISAVAGAFSLTSCATGDRSVDFCSLPPDLADKGTFEVHGIVEMLGPERLALSGERCLSRVSPIESGTTDDLSALAIEAAGRSRDGSELAVTGTFQVTFANVPLGPPRAIIKNAQSLRIIEVHRPD